MIDIGYKGKRYQIDNREVEWLVLDLMNRLGRDEKQIDITHQGIEELGFRISSKHGAFTRYIGDGCFMHLYLMERKDDPSSVQVFIGRDMEFENCEGIYKTVKCMEDLRELVRILG
jgi:hypothetical protein